MNNQLRRLEEIGKSLEQTEHALALLALGSIGLERERLDEYSDLDFFVICEEGYKSRYINNLDWLQTIAEVAYSFQNTEDGHKLLYEDDVFCEFAVFEPEELAKIPFSKGLIVWQKDDFDATICNPTITAFTNTKSTDFLIGEALTSLYIGLGHYHRGERLSAYKLIQEAAVSQVLKLVNLLEEGTKRVYVDPFNITRRFEQQFIETAKMLPKFLQGYDKIISSAEEILLFLDQHFEINESIKQKILELTHQKNK